MSLNRKVTVPVGSPVMGGGVLQAVQQLGQAGLAVGRRRLDAMKERGLRSP